MATIPTSQNPEDDIRSFLERTPVEVKRFEDIVDVRRVDNKTIVFVTKEGKHVSHVALRTTLRGYRGVAIPTTTDFEWVPWGPHSFKAQFNEYTPYDRPDGPHQLAQHPKEGPNEVLLVSSAELRALEQMLQRAFPKPPNKSELRWSEYHSMSQITFRLVRKSFNKSKKLPNRSEFAALLAKLQSSWPTLDTELSCQWASMPAQLVQFAIDYPNYMASMLARAPLPGHRANLLGYFAGDKVLQPGNMFPTFHDHKGNELPPEQLEILETMDAGWTADVVVVVNYTLYSAGEKGESVLLNAPMICVLGMNQTGSNGKMKLKPAQRSELNGTTAAVEEEPHTKYRCTEAVEKLMPLSAIATALRNELNETTAAIEEEEEEPPTNAEDDDDSMVTQADPA